MENNQIFTQEVIEENPFPGGIEPLVSQGQLPAGTFAPTTTPSKSFPVKRTAVELLSTALNTRSRKILEEFELQQSGGFQVGDFKTGISGDLRLTPNGLTARDKAGLTTFAIDGTTGDAIFKGIIRGGSLISETTIEGGSINVNNNFTVDAEGNVTIGVSSNAATGISPSLLMYDDEGSLVGKLEGDVAIARYMRWDSVALGNTIFYESGVTLTNEVMRVNVDDGLKMATAKGITLQGTAGLSAPDANGGKLYVDAAAGKNRLMVIFDTGAAQVIATEP